jgi:hypothetical protein
MTTPDLDAETLWLKMVLSTLTQAGRPTSREALERLRDNLMLMPWMEGAPRAGKFLDTTDGEQRFRRHPLAAVNAAGLSALLMYWPPGHATLPHDHDGLWGIELILDGTLAVHEFVRLDHGEAAALAPCGTRLLGIGDAVLFTGPRYVHRCRNLSNAHPTLTLHIYGSELNAFNVWEPDDTGRPAARRVNPPLDKALLN